MRLYPCLQLADSYWQLYSYWQLLAVTVAVFEYCTLLLAVTVIGSDTYVIYYPIFTVHNIQHTTNVHTLSVKSFRYMTCLCWCEMAYLSATFFISQTFPLPLTEHTKFIWKHPVVIVETFKVKIYLAVSRHYPAQPFCPVLVLAFAWQLFRTSHLRLAPFLGSSIVLQSHNWSKIRKSTVLDSAKPFGWICFFCSYLALSILSPRVCLKERVVAL